MKEKECLAVIMDQIEDYVTKITGSEEAVITGTDYDQLAGKIKDTLIRWGFFETEKPWYTESWYDADITGAMNELGIDPSPENIAKAKNEMREIFDDKSDRNDQIRYMLEQLFLKE